MSDELKSSWSAMLMESLSSAMLNEVLSIDNNLLKGEKEGIEGERKREKKREREREKPSYK